MYIEWLKTTMRGFAPEGNPRRKLLQLLAIVLVIEGLSVLALFSHVWVGIGLVSILIGAILLLLLRPSKEAERTAAIESPGIRFIDWALALLGGELSFILLGASAIILVLIYNLVISQESEMGDLDTISILFGLLLIAYPLLSKRFRIEAVFSLMFTGFVVVFLVLPQVFMSISGGSGTSSVGNWYVEYMLAAPFAEMLDLIGIPASASGNMVTMELKDGTVQLLSISAYCAGLYSFSIFLSAFFSFILVFESLTRRTLVLVLALGLVVAYAGNLVRMVVIGVVGYHYGLGALLWTHENVGWIIFLSWSAVFWYFLLRWTSGRNSGAATEVLSES